MGETLEQLVDDIEKVAFDASQRLPPHLLGEVLAFLTKVSHVLEQAYRDVIPILIDVKYLDAHALQNGALMEINKKIDLVMSISHYRDAEEICSRLKTLKGTYLDELARYMSPANQYDWSGLFGLIEEREGRIVRLIADQLRDIQAALERASVDDLPAIQRLAAGQIAQVRESLRELNRFTSGILGLSGSLGLLEILKSPDARPAVTRKLSIMMDRRQVMGDQHNYSTVGSQSPIIGQGAQTRDITSKQSSPIIDLAALAADLAELRQEMKARAADTLEEDVALGQIAKAEAAAMVGDQKAAVQALKSAGKWAFSVAEKIGVGVAVAAMKPYVGG